MMRALGRGNICALHAISLMRCAINKYAAPPREPVGAYTWAAFYATMMTQ